MLVLFAVRATMLGQTTKDSINNKVADLVALVANVDPNAPMPVPSPLYPT
jgi:hypothetical protein